jgi:hypothetical protein
MSQAGCNVNDVKKPSSLDARDLIELVAGTSIGIDVEKTPDKTIYTINYREYSPPTINVTQSVSVAKVGTTLPTVTFNAAIVKGSEEILLREMTPDKGLNLEELFSWIETNVTSTTTGLFPQFSGNPTSIKAADTKTQVTKLVGVEFRHLFYMGYSTKDTLTENEIITLLTTQDLLTSVKSKYGSFVYNYTVVPTYIYWVYPLGSYEIVSASEGPLPVPLKLDLPNVNITDSGVLKSYRVVRTAVKSKLSNATIVLN